LGARHPGNSHPLLSGARHCQGFSGEAVIPDNTFKLVSTSFGEQAAQALGSLELSEADMAALKQALHDVSLVTKQIPGEDISTHAESNHRP
jgi:hypothetical protein